MYFYILNTEHTNIIMLKLFGIQWEKEGYKVISEGCTCTRLENVLIYKRTKQYW